MAEMYKVIIKEVNGKKIYSSNEMSSMMIQFEIDWININIDLDGLILIIKPIKGRKERREDLLKKLTPNDVNLDDLDKFKI
jgi:hypothetical protein